MPSGRSDGQQAITVTKDIQTEFYIKHPIPTWVVQFGEVGIHDITEVDLQGNIVGKKWSLKLKNRGTEVDAGVKFESRVEMPAEFERGHYFFVQLVSPSYRKRQVSANLFEWLNYSNSTFLDYPPNALVVQYPYAAYGDKIYEAVLGNDPEQRRLSFDVTRDSPEEPLEVWPYKPSPTDPVDPTKGVAKYSKVWVGNPPQYEKYFTYLMFLPPGDKEFKRPVPLMSFSWWWKGEAVKNADLSNPYRLNAEASGIITHPETLRPGFTTTFPKFYLKWDPRTVSYGTGEPAVELEK